jgi:hypothetical protein
MRIYVRIWLLCTLLIVYECCALNFAPEFSILSRLQEKGLLHPELNLSPEPGKSVSLVLGWLGIGTMLLTNLYIFRKRVGFMKGWGRMSGWLNFHIFCGLLGPTFILFHTNFKIGGLVAISFWSMVVSFVSGIVGRYFYMQILAQKSELQGELGRCNERVRRASEGMNAELVHERQLSVMAIAGVPGMMASSPVLLSQTSSVMSSLMNSMWGDFRLRFGIGGAGKGLSARCREALVDYAVTQRRISYMEQFRTIMGYWHSFHMPFAVFMYLIAAIHIVTALLFVV